MRPQKNEIKYLQVVKGLVKLFADPNGTEDVFDISDGLRRSNATKLALAHMQADPAVAKMIADRYVGPRIDLDELIQCPQGSLGHTLAAELRSKGFDPEFFRMPPYDSEDIDYVELRLRKTHDVWHALTGFGTDVPGELGIQAFRYGQVRLPLTPILLAGGIIKVLTTDPGAMPHVMDEITRGWRMGKAAAPLLAQKWEERWSEPIEALRDELGLTAFLARGPLH